MYSALSTLNATTEVPLSKTPNPQLLPGRRSINGCPLLRVCVHGVCAFTAVYVHFGWVNRRAKIQIMGHHTWPCHVTSYLKRDLVIKKKKHNNVTTLICLGISVHAKVLHDPLVQYSRDLNWYGNIDKLAVLVRGGTVLIGCLPITTHWNS